jgi:HicB-like antitoxin of HicAB toxin-antitoxin system
MRAFRSASIGAMPTLTAGNTVYTHPVAKVMISIPDDLLGRLDAQARANRETRSGFLQRLAERELEVASRSEDEEIGRMLDSLNIDLGDADIVQLIREDRDSR